MPRCATCRGRSADHHRYGRAVVAAGIRGFPAARRACPHVYFVPNPRNHSTRSPATKTIADGALQPQPSNIAILENVNTNGIETSPEKASVSRGDRDTLFKAGNHELRVGFRLVAGRHE